MVGHKIPQLLLGGAHTGAGGFCSGGVTQARRLALGFAHAALQSALFGFQLGGGFRFGFVHRAWAGADTLHPGAQGVAAVGVEQPALHGNGQQRILPAVAADAVCPAWRAGAVVGLEHIINVNKALPGQAGFGAGAVLADQHRVQAKALPLGGFPHQHGAGPGGAQGHFGIGGNVHPAAVAVADAGNALIQKIAGRRIGGLLQGLPACLHGSGGAQDGFAVHIVHVAKGGAFALLIGLLHLVQQGGHPLVAHPEKSIRTALGAFLFQQSAGIGINAVPVFAQDGGVFPAEPPYVPQLGGLPGLPVPGCAVLAALGLLLPLVAGQAAVQAFYQIQLQGIKQGGNIAGGHASWPGIRPEGASSFGSTASAMPCSSRMRCTSAAFQASSLLEPHSSSTWASTLITPAPAAAATV